MLSCVDHYQFHIGECSREILTRIKEHLIYTKRPLKNPVDLVTLQVTSAIGVQTVFNSYQVNIKNIKIILKGLSNYIKGK